MAGSSWPALVAGARARASDVELKFDWVEGNIVPMTGGNTTDAAYDLGTSSARWRHGYFSGNMALGLATGTAAAVRIHGVGLIRIDDSTTAVGAGFFGPVDTANVHVAINRNPLTGTFVSSTGRAASIGLGTDGRILLNTYNTAGTVTIAARVDTNSAVMLATGTAVNEFSTDGTMAGDSDLAVPTERAVKAYVDGKTADDFMYARLFGNQTLTASPGTFERILFNTTTVNPSNLFATVSSLYTCPTNGTYRVECGAMGTNPGAIGRLTLDIVIETTTMARAWGAAVGAGGAEDVWAFVSGLFSVSSGLNISIQAQMVTSTAYLFGGGSVGSACSYLIVQRIA